MIIQDVVCGVLQCVLTVLLVFHAITLPGKREKIKKLKKKTETNLEKGVEEKLLQLSSLVCLVNLSSVSPYNFNPCWLLLPRSLVLCCVKIKCDIT